MIAIAKTLITSEKSNAIATQDHNRRVHGYGNNSKRATVIEFKAQVLEWCLWVSCWLRIEGFGSKVVAKVATFFSRMVLQVGLQPDFPKYFQNQIRLCVMGEWIFRIAPKSSSIIRCFLFNSTPVSTSKSTGNVKLPPKPYPYLQF